jgi:voltage-gated potassium channel
MRGWVYAVLEHGTGGDRWSRWTARFLAALIVANICAVTLESVPRFADRYGPLFAALEALSLVVFTVEYLLRLWVAPEHALLRHLSPWRARRVVALGPMGLIDFLAVAPFWFAAIVPDELQILVVFRVVRFLKLTRYSAALRSLLDVLSLERRALFGCLVLFVGATVATATLIHLAERSAQPDRFGTIPDAMWWSVVTLATVGYGDVVPVTAAGRVVASLTIVVGLMMVALPVGIVANAFANEIHRREFVITWGMVARVPLFAELRATEIADIMRLLRARTVEAGAIVTRRGEPAHSMYFVANGEVEIELPNERVRLAEGHFFGEIAVLRRARRSATARALVRTNLLMLDAEDFHALMDRQPALAARIQAVARDRVGPEVVTPRGDIVTEEIDAAKQQDAR